MTSALDRTVRLPAPLVACVLVSLLHGCGGGGGLDGTYTSVQTAEIQAQFDSDGTVVFSMGGEEGAPVPYTVDGEKIVVAVNGQQITFLRDGDCIEDLQNVFGKLCKGGAAGAAANVSTRTPAPTAGTWTATNADGTFTLAFGAGDQLTFSVTPASGSQMGDQPTTSSGTFELEGDTLYAQLADSTPMVLKWVNGAYESSAFGLSMRFTRE
jgi:hypothetical protein